MARIWPPLLQLSLILVVMVAQGVSNLMGLPIQFVMYFLGGLCICLYGILYSNMLDIAINLGAKQK